MGMIRIIMILFMIHLANSQTIRSSVNATNFMAGDTAELRCVFPAGRKSNPLIWKHGNESIELECRNRFMCLREHCHHLKSCGQTDRFKVSRSGNNITLIIKHIRVNENMWYCMDSTNNASALIQFNVHKIDYFVNATDFKEGRAAKLTCVFPADPKFNSLRWKNLQTSTELRCPNPTTCEQDPRFTVSRSGYNITLIIKHVQFNQTRWMCRANVFYHKIIRFNVYSGTLGIFISQKSSGRFWMISSLCSKPIAKIICRYKHSVMTLVDRSLKKCSSNQYSLSGFIPYNFTLSICYATWGNIIHSRSTVYPSINGSDFKEGHAAILKCGFPAAYEFNTLMWYTLDRTVELRCPNQTTCDQDTRFNVSRSGHNITLIIKHVQPNQTNWVCANSATTSSSVFSFTVIR